MIPVAVLDAAPSLSTGKRAVLDKHVMCASVHGRTRFRKDSAFAACVRNDPSDRCPGYAQHAVAAQPPEQALDAIAAINLSLFGSRLVTECDTTGSRSGVSHQWRSPKPHAASGAL
jgi:hypothetical protein